jgi:hypothetical protein
MTKAELVAFMADEADVTKAAAAAALQAYMDAVARERKTWPGRVREFFGCEKKSEGRKKSANGENHQNSGQESR